MPIPMPKSRFILPLLTLALLAGGCRETDLLDPEDPDDDDDEPGFVRIFAKEVWLEGGAFSEDMVPPEWARTARLFNQVVDASRWNSDPSYGESVPVDADDIRLAATAEGVLTQAHNDELMANFASGHMTVGGDLVLFPSIGRFTEPDPLYRFLHINTQAYIQPLPTRAAGDEARTRVVGIAFRSGQGGYVPPAPFTQDPFAGALMWIKATRDPARDQWRTDQRDWRTGNPVLHPSTMRMIIRGDAAVVMIAKSELEELGVTEYRWDIYSYTTDPATEWSHDYTDWLPLE